MSWFDGLIDRARYLLVGMCLCQLGCSGAPDPDEVALKSAGSDPNFHTNTLLVASDWNSDSINALLEQFAREERVEFKLLSALELSDLPESKRPTVDLYLLSSAQMLNQIKGLQLQPFALDPQIPLIPELKEAEDLWVVLGFWPLQVYSKTPASKFEDRLPAFYQDAALCAPASQAAVIDRVLSQRGYLESSQPQPLEYPLGNTQPNQMNLVAESESVLRPLGGDLIAPVDQDVCAATVFFDNNLTRDSLSALTDRSQIPAFVPKTVDGPIAAVGKAATNPLKAVGLIEWLLQPKNQQELQDKYQIHTVLNTATEPSVMRWIGPTVIDWYDFVVTNTQAR